MKRCLIFFIVSTIITIAGHRGHGQCVTPIIISNPSDGAICPTKSDTLTITNPVPGMYYKWYQDGLLIKDTLSSVIHVNEAGDYKSSCDDGATFSNVISVTIIPPPTGTITVNPGSVVCSGTTVTLNVETNPGNVYYWFMWPPNPVQFPYVYTATSTKIAQAIIGDTITTCTNTISQVVSVNPLGQVNTPENKVFCNGSTTSQITFTTTNLTGTTTFSWTNSNPSIGLATNGTGNIMPFLATNPGNGPISATIQVTPTYTNGGISCSGPSKEFTITVNPSGKVNQPVNVAFCNATQTNPISFSTTNTGGTTTYSWTNSNTAIGLTSTGNGNIPSFTATNSGSEPIFAFIEVTPTFSNAGVSCAGEPLSFIITINPDGQVDLPESQIVCNNQSTSAITFSTTNTGGTTTYSWSNNNTSIGLAGSGTGNIASFSAVNIGTSPVIATIIVTPTFTVESVGCTGPSKSFTITVNPSGQVSQPPSQVVCVGSNTNIVSFSTLNTGGNTTFTWTNNNTSIGLAESGTGDITPFIAINSTNAPVVAEITVNATFSNGGASCSGPPKSFTITVNPLGQVYKPSDQVVCNGQNTSVVTFSTENTVGTTTYTWTNSLTTIGLTASGTGNIPSFLAVNNTTAPVVATISVTPHFSHGSVTCNGPIETFTITVNPSGQVNTPTNQVLCKGNQTEAILFSTNNTAGTTTYNWSNNNTGIGLAATGSGNIAPFTTQNATNSPMVALITVTPTYSNLGTSCNGQAQIFSITVNPSGQVNQPSNQTVCHNSVTTVIPFSTLNTGGITTYAWNNDNTGIGLASSGTGNIPSFTASNPGTSPAVANITVTPSFSYDGITCIGPTKTFTITVNPQGQVNPPPNQVVCNGQNTSTIVFSTTNITGTTTYAWNNSNTTIGLATSGTGNIPSFTAINTTTAPKVATITVVPTYTIGTVGCTGPPQVFTITVNPPAQVAQPSSQVVCAGSSTTQVSFITNNTGGTTDYSWTNDTPGIGLAASGTGNIPSFPTTNSNTFPVVATITVSPTYTNAGVTCTGSAKTFTIIANPLGQVNQPENQVLCNGENTMMVSFATINTGGTTTYSWTNNLPSIGLAASGTGNIASFIAQNATTTPITATITVTPHFANDNTTCTGTVKTFTFTINPGGQMIQPSNQVLCKDGQTAAVVFSTNNTGGTTTFSWTNDNTNIGLAATGTGNIAPFTALNTGTSPAIATITVTPQYTNNGTTCFGQSKIFTITVNPNAQVNQPTDQIVCQNSATNAIIFNTVNTAGATSYSWSNTNPSIGLAANGTGNISSFTAVNTGNTAITAIITVTPTYTNEGISCIGSAKSFNITVNPGGQVNQPSGQVLCNGQYTEAIPFTTTNTGGITTYSWTNSVTEIGLPSTGAGDISSFLATNNGSSPTTANIVVTPTYTLGAIGCTGPPKTFSIIVNPTAQVVQPVSQFVCAGSNTNSIEFTTVNSSGVTTYTWSNNNTAIGLAATGTGNILPFTALNSTPSPIVATITVSPSFTNAGVTCSGLSKTFSITVNPAGQVNQPENQIVCNGNQTNTIAFTTINTAGISTYTWTNNTPGIGLSSSGTGNIPSFQAINTSTLPIIATITVTPHFTNGLITCDGPPQSFTITVNPGGQMHQPPSQVLCKGDQTAVIAFSTDNTGGTTTYSWTNDNTSIGLAATGTGTINEFITQNSGTSPSIGTITVIPTYSNNGTTCSGPSKVFTITVNPLGQVNQPSDLSVCHNTDIPTISFSTSNTNGSTSYLWTNNNTAIGLPASGTGDIPSFVATNTGSSPIFSTINVTPIYTNAGISCAGDSKSFIITVNPTGQVNQPGDQNVCHNSSVAAITFSTTNTGGTTTFSWTNNEPGIGLAASGTGDIDTFTAINNGNSPINAIIIVTPYYTTSTSNCQGPPKTFTITVNPIPQITNSSFSKQICTNQPVGIFLTSNTPVEGTSYTWTSQIITPPMNGTISGNNSCNSNCGTDINDNLTNTGSSSGIVSYEVLPSYATCLGSTKTFSVTIQPTVTLSCTPALQEICSGTLPDTILITSNVLGAIIDWTATASIPGEITGFQDSGNTYNILPQAITSNLNAPGTVTYSIIPTISGCSSAGTSHVITVNPAPVVTNDPARQVSCSGVATNPVPLTSNIDNPSFTWHAINAPANLTGYVTGIQSASTIPAMTITNVASTPDSVIYEITPSFSGGSMSCGGVTKQYVFVVNPKPVGTSNPASQAICSGQPASFELISNVTGTGFSWTAVSANSNVTGFTNCSTACPNPVSGTYTLNSGIYSVDSVLYTITPSAKSCIGDSYMAKVIVRPNPNVLFNPVNLVMCSDDSTSIILTSGASGVTFTWTVSLVQGSAYGFSASSGNLIRQKITNTGTNDALIKYTVIPATQYCSGSPIDYFVTVHPVPDVANTTLAKSICSGTSTEIDLTSNVSGTTFTWAAGSTQTFITGYSSGTGLFIDQTLNNTSIVDGLVTYSITPMADGCIGLPVNYSVTVHPVPEAYCSIPTQEVCSGGNTTPVNLSSTVAGSTFSWICTPSSPLITGWLAGSGNVINSQNIQSGLNIPGTVAYTITPLASGCNGTTATHTVTINPSPTVTNTPLSQSICSQGTSSSIILTSNVPGTTFTWTAYPSSSQVTGFDLSGGNTIEEQTIFNETVIPQFVTYEIVPNFTGTTSCPGDTVDYTINILPKPQIMSVLFDSVCSNNPFSYTITSSVANSSFTWSRGAVSGISNPEAWGNTNLINETLNNTTAADINVTYHLTAIGPGSPACTSIVTPMILRVKDYLVDAGIDITIPHGISTDLAGTASGGGGELYFTWAPASLIQNGLHTLNPHTKNIYSDTTFYLMVSDQLMGNCLKNDSVRITLNGSALSVGPFIDPDFTCPGDAAQLFANPSGGAGPGTYSFTWTCDPPGTPPWSSTEENPWVNPTQPTNYYLTVFDGYNEATGSSSIAIKDPPIVHSVTGGGFYCAGGLGVSIGLDGTTLGDTYTLFKPNGDIAATISGNGNPMSFGNNFSNPGIYTSQATSTSLPQCTNEMDSSATVTIIPLPLAYPVTGGGAFSQGGTGVEVGLFDSQLTIEYELLHEDTSFIPPQIVAGTGNDISFGNQTEAGTYTVIARTTTNPVCSSMMLDSAYIIINPWPTVYNLLGGGEVCADDSTGVPVWLEDSEISITYRLFRNGVQYGDTLVGNDDSLLFCHTNEPGIYHATGTNQQTGLMKNMLDSIYVVVNPLPLVYTMGAFGDDCPGTEILLNGSQIGVNYELQRNTLPIDTLAGSGSPLNFGAVQEHGIYSIRAYFIFTGCDTLMNNPITINMSPVVFDLYPIGVSCAGDIVWLSGSEIGIKYQLQRDGTFTVGSPQDGNGDTLNFGPQTIPGSYTILAFNPLTNCNTLMNGVAEINPVPEPYTIVPSGDTCAETSIGLSGSQLGVKYILKRDTLWLDTLNGNGSALEFGLQYLPGIYTVVGYDTTTYKFCSALMIGSTTIHPNPSPYQIIPMGFSCVGDSIGLLDSDTAAVYQLIRDGNTTVGSLVTGNGGPIWFGVQTISGTYTILGRYISTNCWQGMTGNTILSPHPAQFLMAPTGDTCAGSILSLNGSQVGVNYTLLRDGIPITTIPGTGSILSFGSQTLEGNYAVKGTNSTPDSCVAFMLGTLNLLNAPVAYNVVPAGSLCAGNSIGLDDSQNGISYQLFLNATVIDTLYGTGLNLNFGPQYIEGSYTILAIDTITGCWKTMNGATLMYIEPSLFSIVPTGDTCEHIPVGLNGSEAGMNYILKRDGIPVETIEGTGYPLTFYHQTTAGIYTVHGRSNTADSCAANMLGALNVHPLPLAYTLRPQGENCEPTLVFMSQSQAGVEYRLIKNSVPYGPWFLSTNGGYLSFGDQAAGTYQAIGRYVNTLCSDTMSNTLIITGQPVPQAGNDTSVCFSHSIFLQGASTWTTALHWITRGDGTFDNSNIPNPEYTPGNDDLSNGHVWIVLEATGMPACSNTVNRDSLLLLIEPGPLANAGLDDTICQGSTFSTVTASATNFSSPRWETSGSGTFALGADTLHTAVYTPSPSDISSGWVTLTLTVNGIQSCASDSISDAMNLYIAPLPVADAGQDDTICENSSHQLTGTRFHAASSHWETLGDGVFNDPTLLNAVYLPGINDTITGTVSLFLVADGLGQCNAMKDTNYLSLSIHHLPFVNAGPNEIVCAAYPSMLSNAYAVRYSTVNWSTSGDGGFDDPTLLHPIYTPGVADTANRMVTLTITTQGTEQCVGESKLDSLILNYHPMPVSLAGTDTIGCPNEPMNLAGIAHNYSAISWSTLGDGVFSTPFELTTDYLSGAVDRMLGYADLIMSVTGTAQCQNETATDTIRIIYHPLPTASIEGVDTICESDSIALTLTLSGTAPWTVVYTDGMNTVTQSNIQTSPYNLYVNPVTTTSYFLVSVQDLHCTGTVQGGSATIYVNPRPTLYQFTATNGGILCQGTNGVELLLDNSQPGVTYHLYFNNASTGTIQDGSGSPISFGWFTTAGAYKLLCTNIQTQCHRFTDSVFVHVLPLPDVAFNSDSACLGDSTHFFVSGSDINNITLWSWNFGDGTSATYSNPQNPTHIYPTSGTYHVIMDATDTNGCIKVTDHYVTVSNSPESNFSHQQIVCASNNVTFTDLSNSAGIGFLTRWHWFFGDGTDVIVDWPDNPNVSHIFPSAGNYLVDLHIETSRGCSDTTSHLVTVNTQPSTNFTHSAPCQGMETQFTDQTTFGGNAIVSWLWNFGDPGSGTENSSQLQNPHHSYVSAGNYEVKLTITTQNGCIDSIVKQVQVNPAPMAVFTASITCAGDYTQFTDQSVANEGTIVGWLWDFGDGTPSSTVQNPFHLYSNAGIYNVHLIVTNSNQCLHDTLIQIQVYPSPISAFISDAPKCKGTPITFTSQSTTSHGTIIEWHWEWGDGTDTIVDFPGAISLNHVYTSSAMQYTVRLTILTNLGCSSFSEQTIQNLLNPIADFAHSANTCQQESISFSDLSNGNGSLISSWLWNFGDPGSGTLNTSTLQNPQHSYALNGNYNVELVVTTNNNCTDIHSMAIDIHQPPVSDFSSDTSCLGGVTHFTNLSVPNATTIISYDWDFGDGSPHLYVANPTHTYLIPGIFYAALTVTNSNECSHSVVKPVKVVAPPSALFTTTTNSCTGSLVMVHDQSITAQGQIVNWTWDFGDGTVITIDFPMSQDTSHVYQLQGTYNLTLTVQTSDGCTDSHTIPVNIHERPTAAFTFPYEPCKASSVHFTDTSLPNNGGSIESWLWDFGDPTSGINNNSTQQNPDHIFLNYGSFPVTLIISNVNGCLDTVLHNVYIHDAPFVDFVSDTVCHGDSTHFYDYSTPSDSIIAWQWSFGDGGTSNLKNPSHLYGSAGIFTVSLMVTNESNCSHDTTQPVLVRPIPTSYFTASNNCEGTPILFQDGSFTPEGVITTWNWDFGDGQTSDLPSPTHVYESYGTYTVVLTVQNSYGCFGTYSKNILVFRKPMADFTYTNSYCPEREVHFSDHSTAYNTTLSAWNWTFEPGYGSDVQNPVHVFSDMDTTFLVRLLVKDMNGCSDTSIASVFVKPGFNFTFATNLTCTGNLTEFVPVNLAQGDTLTSVAWTFGDPGSGEANHSEEYWGSHQYTTPGSYIVKLKAINSDLCADSILKTVTIISGPQASFEYQHIPHCDTTVKFVNTSDINGVPLSTIRWILPDTTIIDLPPFEDTLTYKFAFFGYHNVTMIVEAVNGCVSISTDSVLVSCISAEFLASSSPWCSGQLIRFNDQSSPPDLISNWNWSFGDGTDTTYTHYSPIITHRFLAEGTYFVRLVTSSISGIYVVKDTIIHQYVVFLSPESNFIAPGVCMGETSIFTNLTDTTQIPITNYYWTFDDPGSGPLNQSSLKDPKHLYVNTGKYNVKLIVTNQKGCRDTLVNKVQVYRLPQADFSYLPLCARVPATFTDISVSGDTSITSWFWDFGDTYDPEATSNYPEPSHRYEVPGSYKIFYRVTDGFGCLDTLSTSLIINPTPFSAFSVTQDYEGIPGQMKFTNLSQNAVHFYWKFGNGKSSTLENPPAVRYNDDSKTYLINLISTNNEECSDTTNYEYKFLFHGIYVPNAFSPTDPNDSVKIFMPKGMNLLNYHITIFDSWGHLLWEDSELDPNNGAIINSWDGNYNGEPLPMGTYVWKIDATFKDGVKWEGSDNGKGNTGTIGTVVLIR
jgi:PKD repeat protein